MGRSMKVVEDVHPVHDIEDPSTILLELGETTGSIGKAEIEESVRKFIEYHLVHTDSGTLYIYFKQLEYAVKTGIENLKDPAFDSLGKLLGGATSGKILGHEIVLAYPNEWHYSPAVDALKNRQKLEIVGLQNEEKIAGIAKQIPGKARLTITLKEG
ncbi:MAG: hypothetical protein JWQ98_1891 [Chlorobi bacterium]|nr:hypothetical protein [Chlorobiota bacterium]